MSNRTLVELNHDLCPKDGNARASWAEDVALYLSTGDKEMLPSGVTFIGTRHHSDPEPSILADPESGRVIELTQQDRDALLWLMKTFRNEWHQVLYTVPHYKDFYERLREMSLEAAMVSIQPPVVLTQIASSLATPVAAERGDPAKQLADAITSKLIQCRLTASIDRGMVERIVAEEIAEAGREVRTTATVGKSLLHKPGDPLPEGCYCPPGKCGAPIIMGRQMPCRDPKKAAAGSAQVKLFDYATGVRGSYCIGREHEPRCIEFWNPSGWSGSGYVFNDKGLADAMVDLLNSQSASASVASVRASAFKGFAEIRTEIQKHVELGEEETLVAGVQRMGAMLKQIKASSAPRPEATYPDHPEVKS